MNLTFYVINFFQHASSNSTIHAPGSKASWGMLVMSFYFGSRGIEKIVDIVGKYRNRKDNG
jgi:hypothetical protein